MACSELLILTLAGLFTILAESNAISNDEGASGIPSPPLVNPYGGTFKVFSL